MVLFMNLELLVLLASVVVVAPVPMPFTSLLVAVKGRFMVQLEMVLLLASFSSCTPQPAIEAGSRVRIKLSNFVKSAPFRVTAPLKLPVVDTMVFPLPLKVMVLVALLPGTTGTTTWALYGPVLATTLNTNGPFTPAH